MLILVSICPLKKQDILYALTAKRNMSCPLLMHHQLQINTHRMSSTPNAFKILIIGPAWVGDMVMAQTLFKLLKINHPHTQLHVLAPPRTQSLLERMPEITAIIEAPFQHGQRLWRKRYDLARTLRAEHYDQAIILPNSFKSALIPFWAKIPQRTGWVGEWRYGLLNDVRKLNKQQCPLMIERFMALGLKKEELLNRPYPKPALLTSEQSILPTLQRLNLQSPTQPLLVLCPGAEFGSSKRWPAEYYAKVANTQLDKGWTVWLLGSTKDQPITHEITTLTKHRCANLAGITHLTEAIDLLSLAQAVITNDSGLMHIAAALQRPCIVLYGSTSPQFTPPLSDRAVTISLGLSCSPCFQRECPLHHFHCMRDLRPEMVVEALRTLPAVS